MNDAIKMTMTRAELENVYLLGGGGSPSYRAALEPLRAMVAHLTGLTVQIGNAGVRVSVQHDAVLGGKAAWVAVVTAQAVCRAMLPRSEFRVGKAERLVRGGALHRITVDSFSVQVR